MGRSWLDGGGRESGRVDFWNLSRGIPSVYGFRIHFSANGVLEAEREEGRCHRMRPSRARGFCLEEDVSIGGSSVSAGDVGFGDDDRLWIDQTRW